MPTGEALWKNTQSASATGKIIKKISGRNTPRIDFRAKYHNIKITCIIAPKRNETKKGYNPDLLRVTGRPE